MRVYIKYFVLYVKKEYMPKGVFGLCVYGHSTIYIRKDLPESVKKSILAHERQHEKDYKKTGKFGSVFIREFRANIAGMKHPIGFLRTVYLTLINIERWKHLFKYFSGNYKTEQRIKDIERLKENESDSS